MTDLPTISIVTPSLNQGAYLEATLTSVLAQNYPALEYVVVDGGSSDDTVAVIERNADRLAWWVSEPDDGQYAAVNKGFARTSGEIMGWLNSDDMYLPWTFSLVGEIFRQFPQVEWLTTSYPMVWDKAGRIVRCSLREPFSRSAFLKGDNLPGMGWHATGWIQQEATFWRRSLWERAGGSVDASLELAADFDLWARFFNHAVLFAVDAPLAGFRRHGNQKTVKAEKAYKDEAMKVLLRYGGRPRGTVSSAVFLALRRSCPNRLKPLASRMGLLSLGAICSYDSRCDVWRIIER